MKPIIRYQSQLLPRQSYKPGRRIRIAIRSPLDLLRLERRRRQRARGLQDEPAERQEITPEVRPLPVNQ